MKCGQVIWALSLQAIAMYAYADERENSRRPKDYSASSNLQGAFENLRSAVVATDLKLSAQQRDALRSVSDSWEQAFRSVTPKYGDSRLQLTKEFQDQEVVARTQLESILRPDQLDRLTEIICQRAGPYLFESADIVAFLQLSPEQRLKIRQAIADYNTRVGHAIQEDGLAQPQVVTEQYIEAQRVHQGRIQLIAQTTIRGILADLDELQSTKYADIVGKPVDVASINVEWIRNSK